MQRGFRAPRLADSLCDRVICTTNLCQRYCWSPRAPRCIRAFFVKGTLALSLIFFFFFVDISLTGTLQVPIFNSFFASIPSLSLSLSPCLFFFVYFIPRDTSDFFYTMHAKHAGWTIRGSIHEKVRNTLPVKMPGKVNCCFVLKEARLRRQRAFN